MISKLRLFKDASRPVVHINTLRKDETISVLIDTGASVPVWTSSVDLLFYHYPNMCHFIKDTTLSGFGGKTNVSAYRIDAFVFGGLTFIDFVVLVDLNMKASFDMIACATMFDGLDYRFDTVSRKKEDDDFEKMIITYNAQQIVRNVAYKDGKIRVYYNKDAAESYLQHLESEKAANLSAAYRQYFFGKH